MIDILPPDSAQDEETMKPSLNVLEPDSLLADHELDSDVTHPDAIHDPTSEDVTKVESSISNVSHELSPNDVQTEKTSKMRVLLFMNIQRRITRIHSWRVHPLCVISFQILTIQLNMRTHLSQWLHMK